LKGVNFNGAILVGLNLTQADLSNSDLLNSTMSSLVSEATLYCNARMQNGERNTSCD